MTGAQGAAAYFAEYPLVDTVLATSDGQVWLPAQANLAGYHASKNGLAAPATYERTDDGMDDLIAVAALQFVAIKARGDASKGVTKETPPPTPVVPPTYEEARADLADALGIDDLTDLEESYTASGVVLLTIDAVIATWYGSGLSVAAWKAQSKAVRQAAVAAKYPDFVTIE